MRMRAGEGVGEFKDRRSAERYGAAYQRALAELWPGPRTAVDLPTSHGTTRVYRVGPTAEEGEAAEAVGGPIVLLPGSGGNALMWHRYVDRLARRHEVIAVDTLGEPGASVQRAPIADGLAGAGWLEELLGALEVTGAHLVGCSYGGWLALHHQLRHPGPRVASLTLVDPAGLGPIGFRFYAWLIGGGLAALAPQALRPGLARLVGNSAILEGELMRLMRASMGYRRALPMATTLTDEQLATLRTPTLVLLGARSALHDAPAVAARLARLVPAVTVELVPGAGHALPPDRPELVLDRILTMAARGPAGRRS
ncbi:alpha/beta fold hydrolase [Kitasatospora sp. MMS16-BH015]|uniref:alpha/beta fold hydrolase n=1 Tax=Kitasatospora sp. MMS16-BH015 TaxID=2018025 RepID=UPI000CF2A5A1|nr:alpha/beta fold hydrolase [Kitasatospora sp. MMS16-BH015]